MNRMLLACMVAASLAGCAWHRDRGTEGSGASVPPTTYQQSRSAPPASGTAQQNAQYAPMPSAARQDWSDCTSHPYNPSAHTCSNNQ